MIGSNQPHSRAVKGYPKIVVGSYRDSRRIEVYGSGDSLSPLANQSGENSLNTDTVYFQAPDGGDTKFRVRLLPDGRTLEIWCGQPFINDVDGSLYGGRVVVVPDQANCVRVVAERPGGWAGC